MLATSNFLCPLRKSTTDAPTYVTRQADQDLYDGLKAGEFCYVLNSRQMGKSSLRVRTMQRLQAEGIACAVIDLTRLGSQNVTPDQWYAGVARSLLSSFELSDRINLRQWWRDRDHISSVQRFSEFIETVLLVETTQRIVVFVDEIDTVLSLAFPSDDFFAIIRDCHNQRADKLAYQRLTFCLLGVCTPSDLIQDKTRTPFNVGRAIQLNGFQLSEAQPLVQGLSGRVDRPQAVLRELLNWTDGQPFLTQKLCQIILSKTISIPSGEEAESVEHLVQTYAISNWESQDEPEHFRTIRDRILKNQQHISRLLGLYQKILHEQQIKADDSDEQIELRLSGLTVRCQGNLKVYNRIYKFIFNQNWVNRELANLRPYAEALTMWISSDCQDESRLLRGQALREAQMWASGKSLTDHDYQFISASQDLNRREIQVALETAEQANQILATAQQQATQESLWKNNFWRKERILVLIAGLIIFLRFVGFLQTWELNSLDLFFRLRPSEPRDNRIVIVGIDDYDIGKLQTWPVPDTVMADLLTKIKSYQPRAIGLDLYRNVPVGDGYDQLQRVFQTTPNLIGIEKIEDQTSVSVEPPKALEASDQIGFNNVVVDVDSRVRRAVLFWNSKGKVASSFALRLAMLYLQKEGITPRSATVNPNYLQLGRGVFHQLEPNDGGYVGSNMGGYQILANLRSPDASFTIVSLSAVLNNQVSPDLMRDRVVVIGSTAPSLKDFFYTSYSNGKDGIIQLISGVELHAQFVSQIISAAQNGRTLLHPSSKFLEIIWIVFWTFVGINLGWRFRSLLLSSLNLVFAGFGLCIICYLAFLEGWWLPLIPPLLGFGLAATITLIRGINQLAKLHHLRRTLELIIDTCYDNPVAGRVAIEYLKQSENKQEQDLISQWQNEMLKERN